MNFEVSHSVLGFETFHGVVESGFDGICAGLVSGGAADDDDSAFGERVMLGGVVARDDDDAVLGAWGSGLIAAFPTDDDDAGFGEGIRVPLGGGEIGLGGGAEDVSRWELGGGGGGFGGGGE